MNRAMNPLRNLTNSLTFCLLVILLFTATSSFSEPKLIHRTNHTSKDVLVQYSTIGALMQGYYDGDISMKQIKQYGDIGIGTFNHLDGEMIIIDGQIYQVASSGTVNHITNDTMKSPFMVVTDPESRSEGYFIVCYVICRY